MTHAEKKQRGIVLKAVEALYNARAQYPNPSVAGVLSPGDPGYELINVFAEYQELIRIKAEASSDGVGV